MNEEYDDSLDDLVKTEKLNLFSVVENYCEICSDITPHHIEDESSFDDKSSLSDSSMPLSILACVHCRENEESSLPIF